MKWSFEVLEPRQLLAADPIITEFMASNGGTLLDGNGTTSDWVEIYNRGDQAVDLAGYHLTDDPTDLGKWQFPSHVLQPGEFFVVFASGNNIPDPDGNIHTSFSLSAGGEYIALTDPSEAILSEFGPGGTDYPAQTEDVSYGLAFNASSFDAVTPTSSAKYLIPTNSSVDNTWTDVGFNDASWQSGTASIGFENSPADYAGLIQTVVPSGTTSVYVRIPFNVSEANTILDTLQMKYDDGFIAYINGMRVTSDNAPEAGAFNSTATAEHPDGLAVNYVNFDISAHSSELQVGTNILAIHMLNRNSGSSDLLAVPNLQLATGGLIEPTVAGTLDAPTPGLPNTNLRASAVEFSRIGGTFVGSFQLTMTSSGANEQIYYTTNGTLPTVNSQLYTNPITINATTEVRARAIGSVGQIGEVTTEAYTRTSASTSAFTSDLPIIVLENFGQGTPGSGNFEDANFALYDVDDTTGRSSLAELADLTTIIGQHRRGSSTSGNPKTNLRIELRDNDGEDRNLSLLGMPSESDWILYAPYNFDRAMMRNTTFFELSRQMGNYASRTRFVEVYMNFNDGELNDSDYMGVYVLMENIKRDNDRVDIARLDATDNAEPDITGGYIIKLDRSDGSFDSSWFTDRNIPTLQDSRLVHVEPERADMTIEQRDYIRGYVQDFEDALFGPNSTDPDLGYQAYFDVNASIDHHLIRVLSKEPDGLRLSTFITKDRNGKLAFGPVWDFDRSSGADDDGRAANPTGWFLPDVDFFESDWWGPLFDDPNFLQRWVDRWQELRQSVLSDANLQAVIDAQHDQLSEAQARNFNKWTSVSPNGGSLADSGLFGWEGEVSHLANWLIARANWIDDQLVNAPQFSPSAGNVDAGTLVTLSANAGVDADIYYTTDGSDPRADGGGVSPSAMLYTGPISINNTTQISARTFGSPESTEASNSSYPGNESPAHGIDGTASTKYLNFGEENSGIIITPSIGSSIVRSLRLTTANDAVERDPTSWELYGTNDSIQSLDNSTGLAENWTLITSNSVSLPNTRFASGPTQSFTNSTAYTSYKLIFPTVKNAGAANSMQIGEIEFFSGSNGAGTSIINPGDNAKAVHVATGLGAEGLSPWSLLVSGLFSVEVPADATNLRIAEVHYHPTNPTAEELLVVPGAGDDEFEFIELVNTSINTISLNGVTLSEGITFDFTTSNVTSIGPGQRVLVVENEAAFAARYGAGFPIAGQYVGNLNNSGDRVVLTDGDSNVIHDFVYDDVPLWPLAADGGGPSLEVVDLFGDYNSPTNWRASVALGGTPNAAAAAPGDFDLDDDIDGNDFLAWQRGYSTAFAAIELTDWQANLGSPAALGTQSETTTAATLLAVAQSITVDAPEPASLESESLAKLSPLGLPSEPIRPSHPRPETQPRPESKSATDEVFTHWLSESKQHHRHHPLPATAHHSATAPPHRELSSDRIEASPAELVDMLLSEWLM